MDYAGVIIEESLKNKDILKDIKVLSTKVIDVKEKHKTPWVKQWTMHNVEIEDSQAKEIAERISKVMDSEHNWYADFKNETHHYIIFRNKVFYINRDNKEQYDQARNYGISLGIPEYQVDFHPDIKKWKQ